LHNQTHPDETLYARLRSAGSIEVAYPAAMDGTAAEAAWRAFVARGRRRHWPWFVVDALVSPLTVLLAPLPGPNLIGYWFVYRAIHHMFILNGLRRVRGGQVEVWYRPESVLDAAVDEGAGTDRLSRLGCDPVGVLEFLDRQRAWNPSDAPTADATPDG
jgi:hypothetical protein